MMTLLQSKVRGGRGGGGEQCITDIPIVVITVVAKKIAEEKSQIGLLSAGTTTEAKREISMTVTVKFVASSSVMLVEFTSSATKASVCALLVSWASSMDRSSAGLSTAANIAPPTTT